MAHKVEIENIHSAVVTAFDTSDSNLHDWFYRLKDDYIKFNNFIDGACADCADSNDIIISRTVFASKLNTLIQTADDAIAALNEFKNALPVLEEHWPVDVADTTGLTNPTTVVDPASGE